MINNIPIPNDFFTTGKGLLAYSWGIVAKLIIELEMAHDYLEDVQEVSDDYWSLAEKNLAISLTIAQQGVEFLLKGKISEISPFLLLSDPPSRWPKPNKDKNLDFSEYRTIDAQDLTIVYNTVSTAPLPEEFLIKFDEMRKKRNKIMHSIDNSGTPNFIEIMESILLMHHILFPDETFGPVRVGSLCETPDTQLGSDEWLYNNVNQEFSLIIDQMSPAKVKRFFKIDMKKRAYYCPKCVSEANHDIDFGYQLARLIDGKQAVFCPICNLEYEVTRTKCEYNGCLGNVIDIDGRCLTCGN
ncbi:hypothetical protein [Aeromonas allosaccharophila]